MPKPKYRSISSRLELKPVEINSSQETNPKPKTYKPLKLEPPIKIPIQKNSQEIITDTPPVAETKNNPQPSHRQLLEEYAAISHRFKVGNYPGKVTIGLFEDKTPGEISISASGLGSLAASLLNSFSESCSLALQYGTPIEVLIGQFKLNDSPTNNLLSPPELILNYVFTWLNKKVLPNGKISGFNADPIIVDNMKQNNI